MRSVLAFAVAAAALLAGCTGSSGDADGDGLPDDFENGGFTLCVDRETGDECAPVASDPERADTDGDGLSDNDEVGKTDPRDVDTDADGLLDGRNLTIPPGHELRAELESRGIVRVGDVFLGERDACGGSGTNPASWDSDRPADGLADGVEAGGWDAIVRGASLVLTSDPCTQDSDSDGLDDAEEKDLGTDPRDADTDDDGAKDGVDADPLVDLAVKLTVQRVTLGGARGLSGADLELQLIVTSPQRRALKVPPGGEASPNAVLQDDAGDTGPSRASHVVDMVFGVVDTATDQPLDLGGSTIKLDLVKGTWTAGGQSGTGAVRLSGADGSVTVLPEILRG